MFTRILDLLLLPLRCLFPNNEYIGFLGVTPLSEERFCAAKPFLRGRVLDLGCGSNRLMREYRRGGGNGVGADLPYNFHADIHLTASTTLPFPDCSFDSIIILAALNHMPDRDHVLRECFRCLDFDGTIIITVLGRVVGSMGHTLWRILGSDADVMHREVAEEEVLGISKSEVRRALTSAGFTNIRHRSFVMGLNHLYLAEKVLT